MLVVHLSYMIQFGQNSNKNRVSYRNVVKQLKINIIKVPSIIDKKTIMGGTFIAISKCKLFYIYYNFTFSMM